MKALETYASEAFAGLGDGRNAPAAFELGREDEAKPRRLYGMNLAVPR